MMLDERTEFADATSVGTPNNSTVNVGDQIDLGAAGRDIGVDGNGGSLYLVIQVTTAITSAGAATVSFLLSSDSVSTLAVNGTQTVHYESAVIPVASLVAGYTLVVPLPYGGSNVYERYLGVQVRENAAQALNGGAINAFLTPNAEAWKAYADAVN